MSQDGPCRGLSLNTATVRKAGATIHLSEQLAWPAVGAASTLAASACAPEMPVVYW